MRLFFSNYLPIPETAAFRPDLNAFLLPEFLLFATDSAGGSGGGGKREGQDQENRLPGKPPSTAQPADRAGDNPENAGTEPDDASGEMDDNLPGLEPKNGRYFKSDTEPDTGIGNV